MSSKELFEKITELVKLAPENRHSYYQLKYLLLGKEPTTQSQLWQCLRQLESKKETIDNILVQIEDLKDEIELADLENERLNVDSQLDSICKREIEVKCRKVKRKKESLIKNVNSLEKKLSFEIQEARFYVQAFEALQQVEPLKDYDDYESQQEFWEAKVSEEINLRLLTKQPLSTDLMKTALSLHENSLIKSQIINLLENCKDQIKVKCQKEENDQRQIGNK